VLKRLDQIACRPILGVPIAILRRSEAIALLLQRLAAGRQTAVTFANANLLTASHRDRRLRAELADMLVLNDGIGVDAASWILHGARFPENLNGTDFTPALLAALPEATRVFLYGARPEVVARAAERLAALYPVAICGALDGYVRDDGAVARAVERSRAQVVLVALGNPLQERWMAANARHLAAPLLIGVGAYFDFVSGSVSRAPAWVRSLRFEWLYRLAREPKRLWRRYTVDGVAYFAAVGAERVRRKAVA
jgi:exopolysaccharide biosynthesis WecB/TagA/CpsF family protein